MIFNLLERHRDKWVEDGDCYRWTGALSGAPGFRPMITIGSKKDGTRRQEYVARLVCEELNGPPPTSDHQVAHDTPNGCIGGLCVMGEHLRWATSKENHSDEDPEERSQRIRRGAATKGLNSYDLPRCVSFDKRKQKYKVRCSGTWLGYFLTIDEAVAARDKYLGGT